MAGNRILIPGLYDSSDESENEEGAAVQAVDDIVIDPATPDACGEEVVVTTEDEDDFEPEFGEMEQEQRAEDEEEEEEYDPLDAPFLIRKPQMPRLPSHTGASDQYEDAGQQSADETPAIEEQSVDEQEEEEEADHEEEDNYFVVDVHNRCVRIMPKGYEENDFTTLEKITAENFVMLNERVHSPNLEDDDHFYCEVCVMSFRICCIKHPLYRILDRPVPHPVDDRAKKTLPAFIKIRTSSIPGAGMGAFTQTDLPIGLVFGPYQGILSKEAGKGDYSWEIRNVDEPPMYLDGSDPKYSNWMRYINSPRYDREQNLVAFQYNGSVYYRVIRPVDSEQELLVWYGAKYGESLGVFSTKRSSTKSRPVVIADAVKNPFIK